MPGWQLPGYLETPSSAPPRTCANALSPAPGRGLRRREEGVQHHTATQQDLGRVPPAPPGPDPRGASVSRGGAPPRPAALAEPQAPAPHAEQLLSGPWTQGSSVNFTPSDGSGIDTVQLPTETLACWAGEPDGSSAQGTRDFASVGPRLCPCACHALQEPPGGHKHRGHSGEMPPGRGRNPCLCSWLPPISRLTTWIKCQWLIWGPSPSIS